MFDSDQKYPGTGNTATISLLGLYFSSSRMGRLMPSWVRISLAGHRLQRTGLGLGQREEVLTTHHPFDSDSGCKCEITKALVLTIPIMGAVLSGSLLGAEDFSNYRGLQFGMSLAAAAKQTGTKPTEARFVHQWPVVIQEMDWHPRPNVLADPVKADPVKDGLLCFLNGELFRIAITYDRYKVEGMTAEDMIEGISATYGTATRPTAAIAYHSIYGEVAPVIARWEDSQYAYNLVRTGDRSSFAMVLYSKRLDALAQAAITEAVRLDTQETPQREIENQKNEQRKNAWFSRRPGR